MLLNGSYDVPDIIECYTCSGYFYKVGTDILSMVGKDDREVLVIHLADGTDQEINYSNICWVRKSNGKKDNLLDRQPIKWYTKYSNVTVPTHTKSYRY